VTAGGGFGFIAAGESAIIILIGRKSKSKHAGYDSVQTLKTELKIAESALGTPSQISIPIGVGFLGWQLETAADLLPIALEARVKAIWFAFGNNLGQWVDFVRNYDALKHDGHKTLVFAQISTAEEAQQASNEWQVDVVVAQGLPFLLFGFLYICLMDSKGIESGGHGYSSAPPLFTLVPSVISSLGADGPPLLAAGGLSHGEHVASLLTLGAAGAVLGTRFLLTPESLYTNAQKQALLAAKESSTVRTLAFDCARGTLGWPSGVDGRALFNDTVKDYDNDVSIDDVKKKFIDGVASGDAHRMLVWAGTAVALMTEIKSAKVSHSLKEPSPLTFVLQAIMEELHQGIVERLMASSALVEDG
jgi:nitronate monooxygenase